MGNERAAGGSDPRWIRPTFRDKLSMERLKVAKKAFTTRRWPFGMSGSVLSSGPVRPRSGDLLLASVDRIGHHTKIELADGRRSQLHVGDEIVVTYADRYAPDAFEAEIPKHLGATHLVAAGGIASTVVSRHSSKTRRPTDIVPIGLIGDSTGTPINISQFALRPVEPDRPRPRTVAVIGTSMNSGKTTTVGSLILGLRRGGAKPGGTKVTGTGSGADYWQMVDAGAHYVADFTDVGLASTYRVPYDVVEANFVQLVDHLTNAGCSDVIIELADGVFQEETARLIRSEVFRAYVDVVLLAAADSMGAVAGVRHLRGLGLPLIGVSGMFTRAPLAMTEVQANIDIPVWSKDDLSSALIDSELLSSEPTNDLRRLERSSVNGWLRDGAEIPPTSSVASKRPSPNRWPTGAEVKWGR